ncbi:ABC transporter substrate-binding protein [Psychromicrobium lacuslunae]|uniref:Leucine-binding protein domain-containing protein n=1 Tax=Psychromicrobium lacuslunae TaxID=1618207 RepID=A0A0D4C273_9MICC|nr:ABC transporter substrate-binding protein [Psychromicrobium lacuslunae]AJT42634.1 hypothetical protein UM93_16245 [Psychromicrobium lacuslunae]
MKLSLAGMIGFTLVGALALAGCGAESGNARLASPKPAGIDALKIGLLLDSTGEQAFLNPAQQAAAQLAVQQINLAGGVNGKPVELVAGSPGGSTTEQSKKLIEQKAAVVIGPTDSSQATAASEQFGKNQTVLISPANAASALSKLSSGGYYFRTAPAETMQSMVLAKLALDEAKGGVVAVIYETDDSSKEIAEQTESALKSHDAKQVVSIVADDALAAAQKAKESGAAASVVIARQHGQEILAELGNAGVSGASLVLGDGATASYGANLAVDTLKDAQGILPGVFPTAGFQEELLKINSSLKSLNYAAETYDAVVLAALAAARAKDSSGPSVAAKLIEVSGGAGDGQKCHQLADCFSLLSQHKTIDYDGLSGPIGFTEQGDISEANYLLYRYSASNLPVLNGAEKASK